ncbi:unnamed protein product, partial [marine sediment metagenome]
MSMNRLPLGVFRMGVCAGLLAGCEGVPSETVWIPTPGEGIVQDEVIVTLAPGADAEDVQALYSDLGVTVRQHLTRLSADLLGLDPAGRDDVRNALEE